MKNKKLRNSLGIAMVEMTIALPIFLTVVVGTFDLYMVLSRKFIAEDMIREVGMNVARPQLTETTCADHLREVVVNHLSEWSLEDNIDSIEVSTIESELADTANVFKVNVTLDVSCVSCSLVKSAMVLIKRVGTIPIQICFLLKRNLKLLRSHILKRRL